MVGIAADKAALVHDYLAEHADEAFAGRSTSSVASRTRTCSTSAAWPSCSATTASSTRSTIRSPRAATASSGAFRGCRSWSSAASSASSAGWTSCSPRPTQSWRRSTASARSGRRTSARAFAGCRRSTSWTGTCRRDARVAGLATAGPMTRRTPSLPDRRALGLEDLEERRDRATSSSSSATTSSTRTTGPARSSRRRKEDPRRGARVPHDQDPPQRHDRHGPVRERRQGRSAARDRRGDRRRRSSPSCGRRARRCRRTGTGASSTTATRSRPATSTSSPRSFATSPIREHEKGLSTGEKQMYTRAKKILASELMYALDKDEDEAEAYLDELLAVAGTPTSAVAAASRPSGRWRSRLSWPRARRRGLGRRGPKAFVDARRPPDARMVLDALRAAGDRPRSSSRCPPGVAAPAGASACAAEPTRSAVRARRAGGGAARRAGRRPRRRAPAGHAGAVRASARRAASTARLRDRRRAGDRHGQGGGRRRASRRRSTARGCGRCRRRRRSAARRSRRALAAAPRTCSRGRPTTRRSSSAPGGTVADRRRRRPRTSRSRRRTTCGSPSSCLDQRRADRLPRPSAPGRPGHRRRRVLHGGERRALPRGRRGTRDRPSSACPSTSTASPRRSTSGSTRSGARAPSTTSTATSASSARRPTCGSGSRPTTSTAARTGSRTCSRARAGLRHRLRALPRRPRGRLDDELRHLARPRPHRRRGLAALLRDARRVRADRASSTSSPTRISSRSGARRAPVPDDDLRFYYEPAVEAMLEAGVGDGGLHRGLRKPVGEIYPARAYLEMAVDAGCPIALSSDAHEPEHLAYGYDKASSCSTDCGVTELAVLRAARAPDGADRVTVVDRDRDRHAPVRGGAAVRARAASRSRSTAGLDGHSDADVLAHAVTDAILGAAAMGDIGQHFPDTDEAFRGADSIALLREVVRARRPPAGGSSSSTRP